jgi:hypothetical protein
MVDILAVSFFHLDPLVCSSMTALDGSPRAWVWLPC